MPGKKVKKGKAGGAQKGIKAATATKKVKEKVPVWQPRKKEFTCQHLVAALAEGGETVYKETLDEFVIPSSKCAIPYDPVQSRLRFRCVENGCEGSFDYACCHCSKKLCRQHARQHSQESQHGCQMSSQIGFVACFCCGEKLVKMEKTSKIWRDQRFAGIYETALRHGWLQERTELDCFLPEELKEACQKRSALVGVHGIVNLSNTCCLSVLLQAFCHTPIFRDYCLARLHRCGVDRLHFEPTCVMCAFTSMIFDLYILPPGECYAPKSIFKAVQGSLSGHGSELGEQEDPAEMINILLNDMHQHAKNDKRKISPELSKKLHLDERELHGVDCFCIVCDMFSGIEQYKTTCNSCQQGRVQENTFRILMLPIGDDIQIPQSPKSELSLEDCLNVYTKFHFFADIKNDCCNVVGANRTNKFRHLPVSLIIQLKRAVAKTAKTKANEDKLKKNRDHIRFPLELDMAPYMAEEHSGATKYKLYSVIVHKGTKLTSGHYVCYIKHLSGRWLCIDDRAVFYSTVEHVLDVQAYMLFYIHNTVEFLAESRPLVAPETPGSSETDNGSNGIPGEPMET